MPVRYVANNYSTREKLKKIIKYIHSRVSKASKISRSNEINLAKGKLYRPLKATEVCAL